MALRRTKPSTYTYKFDDQLSGSPTIDVRVRVDADTVQRRMKKHRGTLDYATIETIPISALLDTGARMTLISSTIVNDLALTYVTKDTLRSPILPEGKLVRYYPIGIEILARTKSSLTIVAEIRSLLVAEFEMPQGNRNIPKVILGRDVLSLLRFDYDGIARKITLHTNALATNDGIQLRRR